MADLNESEALAWLCEELPRLRASAASKTHLEKIVMDVREGHRTATWAVTRMANQEPSVVMGAPGSDPLSLISLNLDPVSIVGDYVCPHDRCSRRCQPDEKGREPLCHLTVRSAPMRFRGRL